MPDNYELGQTVTIGKEKYCIQVNADWKPIKILKADGGVLPDRMVRLDLEAGKKVYYQLPEAYELGQTVTIETEKYCIQVNEVGKPIGLVGEYDSKLLDKGIQLSLGDGKKIYCQLLDAYELGQTVPIGTEEYFIQVNADREPISMVKEDNLPDGMVTLDLEAGKKVYYQLPEAYELGQTVTIETEKYCIQVNEVGKPIGLVGEYDSKLLDKGIQLSLGDGKKIYCQLLDAYELGQTVPIGTEEYLLQVNADREPISMVKEDNLPDGMVTLDLEAGKKVYYQLPEAYKLGQTVTIGTEEYYIQVNEAGSPIGLIKILHLHTKLKMECL